MTTIPITFEADRADITEALAHHSATLKRMPAHWTDRRASIHAKIDGLLTELEMLDEHRS